MKRIGSPNIQISLTSNVSDLVPSPFVQRFYIWNHQLSIHCFEEFESVNNCKLHIIIYTLYRITLYYCSS